MVFIKFIGATANIIIMVKPFISLAERPATYSTLGTINMQIEAKAKKELMKWGWKVIKLIHTSEPGIPDRLALRDKVAGFIEFKRPGFEPTPLQLLRHAQLRRLGFEVIVATSVNDVGHLCM